MEGGSKRAKKHKTSRHSLWALFEESRGFCPQCQPWYGTKSTDILLSSDWKRCTFRRIEIISVPKSNIQKYKWGFVFFLQAPATVPGFPRGGPPTPNGAANLLFGQFHQKLHENEENLTGSGFKILLCRSATVYNFFLNLVALRRTNQRLR